MLLTHYLDRHKARRIKLFRKSGLWYAVLYCENGRVIKRFHDTSVRSLAQRISAISISQG